MASSKQATARKKSPAENGKQAEASIPAFAPEFVEEIRRRAYELYEERGRYDGFAEEDWFRAEQELTRQEGKRTV